MADHVPITAGSGTPIAADDIASVWYQRMKLTDGTADSTVPINAGGGVEANAIRVVQMVTPTATLTNLASSATSAQALASTVGRRGCLMVNDDANAVLLKYGTTASATSYTVSIPGGGYWEMPMPCYTGRIDAIWLADGAGSLRITEMT